MRRARMLAALLLTSGWSTFGDSVSPPAANAVLGKVEPPPVGTKWS